MLLTIIKTLKSKLKKSSLINNIKHYCIVGSLMIAILSISYSIVQRQANIELTNSNINYKEQLVNLSHNYDSICLSTNTLNNKLEVIQDSIDLLSNDYIASQNRIKELENILKDKTENNVNISSDSSYNYLKSRCHSDNGDSVYIFDENEISCLYETSLERDIYKDISYEQKISIALLENQIDLNKEIIQSLKEDQQLKLEDIRNLTDTLTNITENNIIISAENAKLKDQNIKLKMIAGGSVLTSIILLAILL